MYYCGDFSTQHRSETPGEINLFFSLLLWPHPQYAEVLELGIEPTP